MEGGGGDPIEDGRTYITTAHTDELDPDNRVRWLRDPRLWPVLDLCIPWSVQEHRRIGEFLGLLWGRGERRRRRRLFWRRCVEALVLVH